MGVVHHHVAEHLAVGDDDLEVVERRQFGDEEVERLDTANAAAGFDDVANAVGAKQQDHDAGGDVGERALQRQADRQGRRAEHGDDRSRANSELLQNRDQADHQHQVTGHRASEGLQGDVRRAAPRMDPAQGGAYESIGPARQPEGDDEDRHGRG